MNELERLRDKKTEIHKVVKKSGWTRILINQCDKTIKKIKQLEQTEMQCPPPLPPNWDRKAFVTVMNKYTSRGVLND